MGNSVTWRVFGSPEVGLAWAAASALLERRRTGCCPSHLDFYAQGLSTATDLDRFLAIPGASASFDVPLEQWPAIAASVNDLRRDRDWATYYRDSGKIHLSLELTPALISAFRGLPNFVADISTPYLDITNANAELFLSVAEDAQAELAWRLCWPREHDRGGLQLALNGYPIWGNEGFPGHSVFLHYHGGKPEEAAELARSAGFAVLDGPGSGW